MKTPKIVKILAGALIVVWVLASALWLAVVITSFVLVVVC